MQGCDGSLLLSGNNTEKAALINSGLRGFDAIDAAKAAVEKACPGVVSCADILAFAARDSVVLTGGARWEVPAGRRDGRVSLASEPPLNLPRPTMKTSDLIQTFKKKGLTAEQMVDLSGACPQTLYVYMNHSILLSLIRCAHLLYLIWVKGKVPCTGPGPFFFLK
jgi:peroxidase